MVTKKKNAVRKTSGSFVEWRLSRSKYVQVAGNSKMGWWLLANRSRVSKHRTKALAVKAAMKLISRLQKERKKKMRRG